MGTYHVTLCGKKLRVSLDNFPPFFFKYPNRFRVFVIISLQKSGLIPTLWL